MVLGQAGHGTIKGITFICLFIYLYETICLRLRAESGKCLLFLNDTDSNAGGGGGG